MWQSTPTFDGFYPRSAHVILGLAQKLMIFLGSQQLAIRHCSSAVASRSVWSLRWASAACPGISLGLAVRMRHPCGEKRRFRQSHQYPFLNQIVHLLLRLLPCAS